MKVRFPLLAWLLALPALSASPLLQDAFTYPDGPLSGQGPWARGVSSPTADDPSNHIIVVSGEVKFDWTVATAVNNALRVQWAADQLTAGMIYAAFDLRATQAPQAAGDVRPGFFHFDRSGGGQTRGFVGIRQGTEAATFQLGISASSQSGTAYTFAEQDLALNTAYRVMVGYNIATADTFLWLGTDDPETTPAATAGGSPSAGVRRVQLRLYNSDGSGGVTNLGMFYLDNLVVTTGAAPDPDPDPDPDPAEVFLAETFAYDNGPLLDSAPEWRVREGAPAPAVLDNQLQLQPPAAGGDGYVTRNLSRSVESGTVFAGFTLELPAGAQVHEPVNILFLTDSSGAFGRGFVAVEGTAGGWRIGLRGTSGGTVAWSADTLAPGSASRWVMGFDTQTGASQLWLAGDATGSTPRATASGTAREIRRAALGSHGDMPMPPLGLRDLHVALTQALAAADPVDLVALPHPDKVFLFLLIGQSNMAGRGAVEAADKVGNRRIATYNADRRWQVARDPIHWDRPGYNGVGPALSFARELLQTLPPDAVIGLIPAAQGATPISQWEKNYSGSFKYYDDQYLYPHALGRALEASTVGTLAGILWNQGESDASAAEGDGGALYRTRLHRLIGDLRADLGAPELPFIVSTLGPWRTNSDAINSVFLSLPSEVPHTAAVNTLDPAVAPFLVNNPSDTPHYLTPSYRLLGQLYAEAFAPWWGPPPAYVREVGGAIESGGSGHRIRFSTTGALVLAEIGGASLLPAGTTATGQWYLNGSPVPETVTYAANPPLSFKWRNPRTMAAWTAGDEGMGVVLANNDVHEGVFRLELDAQHLDAFRTPQGEWKPLAQALPEQPVDRLRWSLPGGMLMLWSGTGVLAAPGGASRVLEARVPPKGVTGWDWHYGALPLRQPLPHAVYQRQTQQSGRVPVEGLAPAGAATVEVWIAGGESPFAQLPADPLVLAVDGATGAFAGEAGWPAGGWYTVGVTARDAAQAVVAERILGPVGVGEVFVVAGQSNATNSGQTRTRPSSPLVSAFSGSGWRPATDPLPGAHDNSDRGSFQPALGDALVERFGVPVGFASTGQGGSAIRHWQPDYVHDFVSNTFYNGIHQWTLYRMQQFGRSGFRALLWHQGESDAAQGASTNPDKVDTYSAALRNLLESWRADAGWEFPAFTAKASLWPLYNAQYGGDPYLREAQQRVWDEGVALPGPDTDQLGLEYRQDDSDSRVHFNAAGLKLHGELWDAAVGPWLHQQNLLSMRPLLDIGLQGGVLHLQWLQPSRQTVRLETSTTLTGAWEAIDTVITGAEPAAVAVDDPDWNQSGPRFYRLRLE